MRDNMNGTKYKNLEDMPGVFKHEPDMDLNKLYLSEIVKEQLWEFINHIRHHEKLNNSGMDPRLSLLLSGPTGNGKRSIAEGIATEISEPFFEISACHSGHEDLLSLEQRFIDINKLISKEIRCVLFLEGYFHGTTSYNIQSLTRKYLLSSEARPNNCILVASIPIRPNYCTPGLAHFDLTLAIDEPTPELMKKYFSDRLNSYEDHDYTADELYEKFKPKNFLYAGRFFLDVRRSFIMSDETAPLRELIDTRLRYYLHPSKHWGVIGDEQEARVFK